MTIRSNTRFAFTAGVLVPAVVAATAVAHRAVAHGDDVQERFLYVTTISQSAGDPDFIAVIGADPERPDFGEIVNRVDMPNVGDELHHFGYSADQQRLIVPGLFSNRVHVLEIDGDGSTMTMVAVNEDLVADSGYAVPHGVMAVHGMLLAPMIGAANDQTQPGGVVRLDDRTGEFVDYFGPGPERATDDSGPTYMYDFAMTPDGEHAISSTFGAPAACAPGIDPACLGDEVAVWDVATERVIQTAGLGDDSGALMVRFLGQDGLRRAFINAPGTSAVWLAHDDDGDGTFEFEQGLGPDDGLEGPMDLVLSSDGTSMYLSNWFGNNVQRFDIGDPFHPKQVATMSVPHPNMLRLSPDGSRLYVTNSLLTPWDNDADFGEPRNSDYGIWLFDVGTSGEITPLNADGSPWVSFAEVDKQTTTGPAGPHMMLFDPSIPLAPGEH
jgi:selenium-binding protein 1